MALKSGEMNSTIGSGSSFEGKFYISGSLRIDGKFEGEIRSDEELVVGVTGKVKTDISAKSVVIAGTVIGNIVAEEEVKLLETGRVLGDIMSPVVSMQNGVVVLGRIEVTGGNKKDIRKFIEDSFGGSASAGGAAQKSDIK